MDRPFRFHLTIVQPRSREEARQRLGIIRELKRSFWVDNEVIERIIELGDEELFLFALRSSNNPFTPYTKESYERIGRIVRWALSVMRVNGEAWNPIVDELVAQDVIWKLKSYRIGREIDDDDDPLPDADELTTGLASWIEAQQDPKAFEELFTFRANAVRIALARHARVIDDDIFARLLTDQRAVRALAGNAHLPASYRERLATKAWEEYRGGVRGKRRSFEAQEASFVLGELARSGPGLPAEIRNAIIKRQRRVANPDRQHIDFLVDDRGLTAHDAKRLIPLLSPEQAARLIQRGVLTQYQVKKLLAVQEVAEILLADKTTSGAWIDHIVSAHSTNRFMLWQAAKHPSLRIETIRRMAILASDWSDVIGVLIGRPESLEDSVARESIMSRPHPEIAATLLPQALPEEYPRLLARIADGSVRRAVEQLECNPPPQGTVMPPDLVARLLRSEESEVRLKAITFLSQIGAHLDIREPDLKRTVAR